MNPVLGLQNIHVGKTVYVIGSGPSLGNYCPSEINLLNEQICIGVNKTQYIVKLNYFVSSYISEILLAKIVDPLVFAIHTRPINDLPLIEGINTIKRVYSEEVAVVENVFNPNDPCLITRNNVAFLATHLAVIMGANRIVYVGCEQRNQMHFYNENYDILERIVLDMCRVVNSHVHLLGADHPYERPANIFRALTVDPEFIRSKPFYIKDHGPLLKEWFSHLFSRFGTKFYSCASDSVLVDAGALHVPLTEALAGNFP